MLSPLQVGVVNSLAFQATRSGGQALLLPWASMWSFMCFDHFLLLTLLGGWHGDPILQFRKLRLRN